ncbi:MAG: hypothetical protein JNM80_08110 [Phycisphaerae bacterium]|nr:hypothetical protein [Phycisphaerae bacterium]
MIWTRRATLIAGLTLALAAIGGCNILGFGGAMVESYRRNSTHLVKATYTGLAGKSWAVVVSADRSILGENPDLAVWVTTKITERLVQAQNQIGAGGYVPAERVLRYQYDNPSWNAKAREDLIHALGVQRLIFIEFSEYRLHEPGNQYLWDGEAAGTLSVYEAESPQEAAFEKAIQVKFPDKQGFGPNDYTRKAVTTVLCTRFVDRASWLFYDHQEPYYPDY